MRTVSDGTNIIIQILSEPVFKNVNLLMRINVDGAEGVRKPGGSVFLSRYFQRATWERLRQAHAANAVRPTRLSSWLLNNINYNTSQRTTQARIRTGH